MLLDLCLSILLKNLGVFPIAIRTRYPPNLFLPYAQRKRSKKSLPESSGGDIAPIVNAGVQQYFSHYQRFLLISENLPPHYFTKKIASSFIPTPPLSINTLSLTVFIASVADG